MQIRKWLSGLYYRLYLCIIQARLWMFIVKLEEIIQQGQTQGIFTKELHPSLL
jgi:hypothetical protein